MLKMESKVVNQYTRQQTVLKMKKERAKRLKCFRARIGESQISWLLIQRN